MTSIIASAWYYLLSQPRPNNQWQSTQSRRQLNNKQLFGNRNFFSLHGTGKLHYSSCCERGLPYHPITDPGFSFKNTFTYFHTFIYRKFALFLGIGWIWEDARRTHSHHQRLKAKHILTLFNFNEIFFFYRFGKRWFWRQTLFWGFCSCN